MDRRGLVANLARALPGPQVVAYPDHPLLLKGPDVIAAIDGRLTVFFIVSNPRDRPSHAGRRASIVLTRFALPVEATFVLVVSENSPDLLPDDLALFDLVHEGTSYPTRWPATPSQVAETASVLSELRGYHLDRFSAAWTGRGSPRRQQRQTEVTVGHDRRPKGRMPVGLDWDNGILHASLPDDAPREIAMKKAATFASAAVENDYEPETSLETTLRALSAGERYLPVHQVGGRLAGRDRSYDLNKPLRAMAFAGFRIPQEAR